MRASRRAGAALSILLCACGAPEPELLDIALTDSGAGNPTVAMAEGEAAAYAAWIETTDAGSDVRLAVIDSTGVRRTVRVNDVPGDAAPHDQAPSQVATGADGAVYVVWQNNTIIPGRRFPASDLRFARSLDSGRSFEPATFVNDDAGGAPTSHTFQDIAVSGDGTIYVSWIDGRGTAGPEIRVAKSSDGGVTFGPGVVAYTNACPCCRTSLAVHGRTVAVAFRSAAENVRDIVVVRSTDGGETFGTALRVHEDGWVIDGCPHAGASLAFDAAGAMHVAWYTGAADRQGLWYATATDSVFSAPVPIQTGGWVPVSQVKLAPARDRQVWVTWDDRREDPAVVRTAMVRGGRVEEVTSVVGTSPAVAAGRDVIVAWQSGSSAAARIIRAR